MRVVARLGSNACFLWRAFVLCALLALTAPAEAATRLGLHVTQEELNCWRQRAGDVPANSLTPNCSPVFVNTGDYPGQPNSPADWTNVVNDKNSFMSNPNINDFNTSPIQIGTCNWANSSTEVAGNIWGHIMRASFYAMVRQNAPDRNQVLSTVINKLQQYATDPKLNFNDTTTWCKTSSGGLPGLGGPPMFALAIKMTEVVHAYDYWSIATGSRNTTVENWLRGALNLYVAVHDFHRKNTWWIDPDNGNYTFRQGYTSCAYPSQACMSAYWGGPVPKAAASWFNNRAGTGFELMAAIANLLNDSTKLPKVKKYFEEVIIYGTIPDVSVNGYNGFPSGEDIIRWWDGCPGSDPFCQQNGTVTRLNSHGFAYSFGTLTNLMSMADVYARNGDPSLFEFTTTSGQVGAGTLPAAGIVKSLRNIMRNFSAHARQDVKRTAGGNATGVSNTAPIMQGMLNGTEGMIHDTRMLVGNLYYNDPYVKAAYMRTYTNAPKWNNGSGGQLNFWAVNYPTMLFQRGLLEGVVNPYTLVTDTTPPTNPTLLAPTVASSTQIDLSWNPASDSESGIFGYKVYWCSGSSSCTPSTVISLGSVTNYAHTGLFPSTVYRYQVSATNGAGLEGGKSAIQSATTPVGPSPADPIAWYAFDESSGTIASDSSGSNRGTLVNGPLWVPSGGKIKGAIQMDGVDDYVSIPNSASLSQAGDLTVAGWVYPTNIAKGRQGIIFKHHNNEYEVVMEPTGLISFYHGDGAWEEIQEPAGMVATQSQWNHIAVTRTMSDKTIRFYLDGTFLGSDPFVKTPLASTNPVIIGDRTGASYYFQGLLDDIRIYNQALPAAEIQALANPSALRGDLNASNTVDLTDLRLLIQMIVGQTAPNLTTADLDSDGQLSLSDIRELINILISP